MTLGPEGEGPQLPAPAGFWGPHSPSPRGKRGTGIRVWLTPPFIPIPRTPPDGQIAPSAGDSQRGFPAPLGRAVGSPQPSPSPLHGARPALGWIRTLSAKGPKAEMLRSRLHPLSPAHYDPITGPSFCFSKTPNSFLPQPSCMALPLRHVSSAGHQMSSSGPFPISQDIFQGKRSLTL